MNNIFFQKKEDPSGIENRQPGFQENKLPENITPENINITEGGEFLDDAIRMHDQPLFAISLDTNDNDINFKK